MAKLKQPDWFYLTLAVFMVSLPFSEALISVSGVLLLLVSFFQASKQSLVAKIKSRKNLLLFSTIYLIYLIGFIFCSDLKWGIYDLQKNIPFLIIPFAFILGKKITEKQLAKLLKLFAVAVLVSAIFTMIGFYFNDEKTVLRAQEFGFIHHIRFSSQVIFALVIFSIFLLTNQFKLQQTGKMLLLCGMAFLVVFLIWHQSFTGIITFLGTAFFGLGLLIFKLKDRIWRTASLLGMVLLILVPSAYLYYAVEKYYSIDNVDEFQLETTTIRGGHYVHDFENVQVENGHFVGLYWSEAEMVEAWNNRANLKYEEIDQHGYQVKYTLGRYLTSKNLRKDAEGVNQLTDEDVLNIEAGISNYILAQKGLSLYPRIYVSIWELDNYFKTGYANGQSLSQRVEYVKAALFIIKKNFWFGVGTGNWKSAYREAYQQMQSKMAPARYGDAHNQYLNYMVKFGMIGLLWVLFVILYPVLKTKKHKNPLFLLFLISVFIANLGDSNFETHVGSSFFVLFYCLFISSEKEHVGVNPKLR
jgi:hypothetical protein